RPEARERILRTQREERGLDLAWEVEHPRGGHLRLIQVAMPTLRDLPLSAIATATALSLRAASNIRFGGPPHPQHWARLRALGESCTSNPWVGSSVRAGASGLRCDGLLKQVANRG